MATTSQSALITGGASGMGLEVVKALARRGGWHLHLLDLNAERGKQAASEVGNATFHKVNVLDYDSLANVFQEVYDTEGRLDFVFANAGIVERFNFYESHPPGKPPPPPDQTVVDINLKSVLNTAWLAQHYFRQSTDSDNKNLIMTSSVGGFYRCLVSPSYCASKHGVVGLMRSIAPFFYKHHGVRVNAICPASVRTNLLDSTAWNTFDKDVFVPIEKISEAVLMLIDGYDLGGKAVGSGEPLHRSNGVTSGEKLYGQAVELSGTNHYYREQIPLCSGHQAACMKATERETYVE
ncbi:hypothetical protein M409DRAFT_23914 [Zasmidium cellare ATCC 36951]|uniref:Uncharacterized protein n=1 Tax=Zasmidium cellare ATCC 36951 TaxID=1080233 RepID=A0A6A6CI38_ZASCE|nr:uncharacterized protein M409DRAFT_23914 [Zasmidium cellare ATCC 36951]KAF2165622.1 hypothetical protein M409DRAFT_23914 [Zasmidium cellare ATCC 36951]